MQRQIKAASISAVLFAAVAGTAYAQGSVTQDPGRMAPGNLTTQYLGPSAVTSPTGAPAPSSGTIRFRSVPGSAPGNGAAMRGGYRSGDKIDPNAAGLSSGNGRDERPLR